MATVERIFGVLMPTIMFVGLCALLYRARRFFRNYHFSPEGIDVLALGGLIRMKHIKRSDIIHASVAEKPPFYWFIVPPGVNFMSALRGPVVVVKTTGGWNYYLTPDDPHSQIHALGNISGRSG